MLEQVLSEVVARQPRLIARGIVTAVSGSRADVKLDGASVATPGIMIASGLTVAANDYVVVIQFGDNASDRLVIAKIPV